VREGGHWNKFAATKDHMCIYLISYDWDPQVSCSFNNLEKVVCRVYSAARIVRVDDDNGSRGAVSQGAHTGKVCLPPAPWQQVVEPGLGAGDLAGRLVRCEARAQQEDVCSLSPAEHRGDGAHAAHGQEHIGVADAVAHPGREVVGDCAVVDAVGTQFSFLSMITDGTKM